MLKIQGCDHFFELLEGASLPIIVDIDVIITSGFNPSFVKDIVENKKIELFMIDMPGSKNYYQVPSKKTLEKIEIIAIVLRSNNFLKGDKEWLLLPGSLNKLLIKAYLDTIVI